MAAAARRAARAALEEKRDTGPSVDSDNKEERIAARRLRIAARAEQERKRLAGEVDVPVVESGNKISEKPVRSLRKMELVDDELAEIEALAKDKVVLVRIATDHAESQRRLETDAQRTDRLARLQEDETETTHKFENISSQWDAALAHTQAEDLKAALDALRAECDALTQSKATLIDQFKTELKAKDDEFVKALRTQAQDLQTMLDSVSEHSKSLWDMYRTKLEEIEATFMEERADLLKTTRKEWDQQMAQRRGLEEEQMQDGQERLQDFQTQVDHLHVHDADEYHLVKLKLEGEVEKLQQQLQHMRATYQTNSEKLDYNFQVLKKRDEENTVAVSQQKRKINRLQDALSATNSRTEKQEKQFQSENATLTEDYRRNVENLKELQKKARHFQTQDQSQFDAVWEMNQESCVALAERVLQTDQVIHEQQLGLKWLPPLSEVFNPTWRDDPLGDSRRAQDALPDLLTYNGGNAPGSEGKLSKKTIRMALELLSQGSDFLIEAKTLQLLAPLDRNERCLLKLDAIFKALGVETEQHIMTLASYMLVRDEATGHESLIALNEVPAALRQFVEDQSFTLGANAQSAMLGTFRDDKNRVADYWARLKQTIPPQHDRVWDALADGLSQYRSVLEGRRQAIEDCAALGRQNEELRALLQTHMSSQLSRDLQVPPLQGRQLPPVRSTQKIPAATSAPTS